MVSRVAERIDARREEAVRLLEELVRVNSVNPNYPGVDRAELIGGETRVNEILKERYEDAGLETHWVAEDPERRALVGVRAGAGGGRSLLLNGHIDTVPAAEGGEWTHGSPWEPAIVDGRLYGLGSTDMKASAVSMWLVARALEDAGVRLAGELQLHSVVGEETGEYQLGTLACVRAGFRADGAIVTEPSNPPRPLTITPVSAGFLWLKVVVEGLSTHAGNRPLVIRPGGPGEAIGVNALEKGARLVRALQELEERWGLSKSHPYFSPGWFTIMPGLFRADPGVPFPAYLPNRAELHWAIWYPPQEAEEDVMREIEEYVLAVCQLDPWLAGHPPSFEWPLRYPGMRTAWEHELPQTMARAWERVTGEPVPPPSSRYPVNFGAAMEGTWLEREGIPSIVFGPGDLRVAHAKDEYVVLDEMILAAKGLAACAMEWCGVA
ncbi:MAG: M20/M25/M40 family metallo-hydrolase [Thermoleophilia bacterium]|nr:M20/M25/M40 family metallo-hydrolase [Thermoleophilia bacterium]